MDGVVTRIRGLIPELLDVLLFDGGEGCIAVMGGDGAVAATDGVDVDVDVDEAEVNAPPGAGRGCCGDNGDNSSWGLVLILLLLLLLLCVPDAAKECRPPPPAAVDELAPVVGGAGDFTNRFG